MAKPQQLKDPVRAAQELKPLLTTHAAEIELNRELPPPVVAALVERDLFRLLVPRDIGGTEVSPLTLIEVIEAIAMHDASTAWCIGQNTVSAMIAAYLEPSVARQIFGEPTGVVAWGPPSKGQARVAVGGYVLSGTFNFASGSRHATWLGAHVPVVEADGATRTNQDGSPIIHTLVFEKHKARIVDNWHVIGLKGTGSDSYVVDDVFVPSAFTIRRNADSKPRSGGALYRFGPSSLYAASFASVALGIARSTLDAFLAVAREKVPRGGKRVLRENHYVQHQVGMCEASLRAARTFLVNAFENAWRHASSNRDLETEQNVELRLATTWAIRQSADAVASIYDAAGATAVFASNPFERRFRDIHAVTQQIQGHRANFETVGQVLLGAAAERRMFTF